MSNSIGTKIGFFRYDGGEGWSNEYRIFGFCKENLQESYDKLKDKYIISKCEIADKQNLDYSYGITIEEYLPVNFYGLEYKITGSISEIINIIDNFVKEYDSRIKKNKLINQ